MGQADLSRRRMLQLMGAGAGSAVVMGHGGGVAHAAAPLPFTPRGRLRRRPNFLVITVDEMHSPPVYESEELRAWRAGNLPNMNSLQPNGFQFTNHHIMASACSPSRASLFTGQYPSLHGVTQTYGSAKSAVEDDMYWLDATSVPTMGHWFRAAGYDTYYKGKWHVTNADIYQPGSYVPLPSYDKGGSRDAYLEEIYLESDRLDAFGFEGWVGPEPHGSNSQDSGSSAPPDGHGRDEVYAAQGAAQLMRLRHSGRPWLLVTSFVNPHDIGLWGDIALKDPHLYLTQQLQGSTVPEHPFDGRYYVSSSEDLASKPDAQASYRDLFPQILQPITNNDSYHRFYYQLHANVDQQIGKVLDALRGSTPALQRDTIVIFLSDHGTLLGCHGGMFEKSYQAYDETVRVPFTIHNPQLFPEARSTDVLTSHADLLPTMLGLAGVDIPTVERRLRRTHTQVQPLPGRDLSPLLLGERPAASYNTPQYFMNDDDVSRGSHQVSLSRTMYAPVVEPNHIETVIAQLPTGEHGSLEQWKYSRYFDDPRFWSDPEEKDVMTIIDGNVDAPGQKTATTTVKIEPVADQIEVYNITRDPTELTNLATDKVSAATVAQLAALLAEQRELKRLMPVTYTSGPAYPGGSP